MPSMLIVHDDWPSGPSIVRKSYITHLGVLNMPLAHPLSSVVDPPESDHGGQPVASELMLIAHAKAAWTQGHQMADQNWFTVRQYCMPRSGAAHRAGQQIITGKIFKLHTGVACMIYRNTLSTEGGTARSRLPEPIPKEPRQPQLTAVQNRGVPPPCGGTLLCSVRFMAQVRRSSTPGRCRRMRRRSPWQSGPVRGWGSASCSGWRSWRRSRRG